MIHSTVEKVQEHDPRSFYEWRLTHQYHGANAFLTNHLKPLNDVYLYKLNEKPDLTALRERICKLPNHTIEYDPKKDEGMVVTQKTGSPRVCIFDNGAVVATNAEYEREATSFVEELFGASTFVWRRRVHTLGGRLLYNKVDVQRLARDNKEPVQQLKAAQRSTGRYFKLRVAVSITTDKHGRDNITRHTAYVFESGVVLYPEVQSLYDLAQFDDQLLRYTQLHNIWPDISKGMADEFMQREDIRNFIAEKEDDDFFAGVDLIDNDK